ncbi:phage tail tape measure protein [Haemophilus pittmaniae]|uniref:phage tail tape measure protein n=1 Tax=Haemophilus pittmaniae TaxID=249188 RepID=UPI0028DC2B35|nr:phage tail tape measure protein [Haemophilus pittmaniae]
MADFATLGITIQTTGADRAERDLKGVTNNAKNTEQAVQSLSMTLGRIKTIFAAGLGIQGINQIIQMGDKMNTLNAQVKLVSRSTEEFTKAQEQLFNISQRTRGSLEATTTLYVRSSRALKDFGYSQQRVLNFTETLNKAMAVGGVGAQEQASALFQLSQALGSGRLQGDEFRTIAEAAPIILDTIAEYMGKSRSEIKALGSEGKITSEIIFKAMESASGKISKQFEGMPLTFGQAMQQMENSTMKFVDDFAQTTGVFSHSAEAVSFLARNFDSLSLILGSVLIGQLGKYSAAMVASTIATQRKNLAAQGLANTLKGGLNGALGLLGGPAGAITIAASALFYFVEQAEQAKTKALDLEGANRLLEKSYKDLSIGSLGIEMSKQLEDLNSQKEVIERIKASIGSKKEQLENNQNPFFDYKKTEAEISALERQLVSVVETSNIRNNAFNNLLEELATRAISSGQSLKEFRDEMTLAGVSSEQLDKALSPLNTDLIAITGQFQRLFPGIDTTKISMDGLSVSIGGFNVIAPSAENAATSIAAGISRIAAMAAVATGNLDVLKKSIAGATGISDSVKGIIDKNSATAEINKLRAAGRNKEANEKQAAMNAESKLISNKIGKGTADWDANYNALYQSELGLIGSQELKSKAKKSAKSGGRGTDYVKQYTDQVSRMENQLSQSKANVQDLGNFGRISQYQEVNKLTQDIAANGEKYAHFGAEGLANLKRLAGEIDSSQQQFDVKQLSVTNQDKIRELEFGLELMGKTRVEQEQMQFAHQLDVEASKMKVGMTQENIANLDLEIAKLKELHAQYQENAAKLQADPMAGIRDGFNRFGQEAGDVMGNVSNITLGAFNGMSDALTDLVMTGKADFGSLAKSIIKDIIQMTIKMMIFKAISSMFGGYSGGGPVTMDASGVVPGFDEGGFTGVGGKYQPAGVVHKGEYVMTKEATAILGVDFLNFLNYKSKARPQGFANGGMVGGGSSSTNIANISSGQTPNIKVNIINNGNRAEANVSTKHDGDNMEITIELMREIADERYNENIQRDFGRSGGAFAGRY